ncbi:MAG: (d)CMP kinase [Actinomycetia bacterium]|nr:(d)CMP kinase [Actinomycetes bacterium]
MIIAIDGSAGSGKSTLAKRLALEKGYEYVDTGAMYRAVTYYFIKNKINYKNPKMVEKSLEKINISFNSQKEKDSINFKIFINGQEISEEIRSFKVSNEVSEVSKVKGVREFLVEKQRETGNDSDIVIEGRDIGTVVFPQADFKIFLSADTYERMKRRHKDFLKKGVKLNNKELNNVISKRDLIDSSRKISPLQKAADAVEIDTTNLLAEEVFKQALKIIDIKKT